MPISGSILQLASRQLDLSGGIRTDIIPYVSDTYDIGSPTKLFRTGYLSELYSLLFSQNTIVLLGSKFVVGKGQGALVSSVSASATQVDFGIPMTNNDFVLFRVPLQMEAMQIVSLASGSTVYNVTRNVDGSGTNSWSAGDVFLILGYNGDGRIELNADSTPQMNIYRQGVTWNGGSELIRIGDLNNNWGYASETYGAAFGEYAPNKANITIDATSGLRLRNYATDVIHLNNSGCNLIAGKLAISGSTGAIAIGTTPPSGSSTGTGIWIDKSGLYGVNSGSTEAYIDSFGVLYGGGGAVSLSSSGMILRTADYPGDPKNSIRFINDSGSENFRIETLESALVLYTQMEAGSAAGKSTYFTLTADAPSSNDALVSFAATKNFGSEGASLYVRAQSQSVTAQDNFVVQEGTTVYTGILNSGSPLGSIAYTGSLISFQNSEDHIGYIYIPSGSPLTSGSFDGDSFSTTAKTLIDLSAVFGAPAKMRAVQLNVSVQDSGASGTDCYVQFSKNNIAGVGIPVGCMPANDRYNRQQITVPCNANGDIYYEIVASGANTFDMYIQINGYYI